MIDKVHAEAVVVQTRQNMDTMIKNAAEDEDDAPG